MKKNKILLTSLLAFSLTGCTLPIGRSSSVNSSSSETSSLHQGDEPEDLLGRFFDKVEMDNYSIVAPVYSAYVYNEDLVHLAYDGGYNYYYMTLNKNELYYLDMEDGETLNEQNIVFLGKGHAVYNDDAFARLLLSWEVYLSNNIWDTFTNHPDDPLRFTIEMDGLGGHILENLATVPGAYKNSVESVDLVLNDKDPTGAKVEVLYSTDEIETTVVEITFGIEKKPLAVDPWLNNENRYYPAVQTEWGEQDLMTFVMTFNQTVTERMDEAVPFPREFATRTFHRYGTAYGSNQIFFITDTLATKEGYENYMKTLVEQKGFERHKEIVDGVGVDRFDKMLYSFRDKYFLYSSIYLEYTDEGVNMIVKPTYNDITFLGRDVINTLIDDMHFPALPANPHLTSFLAHDDTFAQCEGYWFANPYTQCYMLEIDHDDAAEAQEYLDSYYDVLIADGFIKSASSAYISKDAGEEYSARLDSDVIDDKVYIEFWYTEYLSDEEVASWMDGYDFPSIDVAHLETIARDATKYYEYDSNVYQKDILSLDVTFASVDERNEYMTSFVLRLLNEEGFEEVDARKVKVARRDTAFYNASKGLIIAYNDNNTQQIVNFHLIKVADSFSPLP
ncbi:MAG: hypothetical protein J6V79_00775 [Bacilli bacterium]|nr:hypothetical protein [Bacilli bacterium]